MLLIPFCEQVKKSERPFTFYLYLELYKYPKKPGPVNPAANSGLQLAYDPGLLFLDQLAIIHDFNIM